MTQSIAHLVHSGGRKTAHARVQLTLGSGSGITINGKPAAIYFQQNAVFLQNLLTCIRYGKNRN